MRYFSELAYKGTNYSGWQRQPNAPSVQQAIEEARMMRMEFSNFRAEVSNWQRQLQVKVAYTDIEDVGDTLTNIRADASL